MKSPRTWQIVAGVAALVLFAVSLRSLGSEQIFAGLARIGWGFLMILLLSGAREAARALAWTRSVDGRQPLQYFGAWRARLAGEALNTLLPMGMVVGEPIKASLVSLQLPFRGAVKALAVEFAFYSASLVLLFAAGGTAVALVKGIRLSIPIVALGGIAAIGTLALVVRLLQPAGRLASWRRGSPDGTLLASWMLLPKRPRDVATIVACEIAFQIFAVAELYYTLALLRPQLATVQSALVLETVSRVVTMAFKFVPMRIGVDEATSSFTAGWLHLDPGVGIALALVRKLRLLFWSAVGLALLVRRPSLDKSLVERGARLVFPGVAVLLILLTPRTSLAEGSSSAWTQTSPGALAQQATAQISGTVSIAGGDNGSVVIPGVTLTLSCAGGDAQTLVSNEEGEFKFTGVNVVNVVNVTTRSCSVTAELQGFKSVTAAVAVAAGETAVVTLHLDLETLHEEVTVNARPIQTDDGPQGARVERITSSVMQLAPIASDRFQDALPLIPGVVRGPDGLLNIKGTRSSASAVTFNNTNGTDPVTGEEAIELPIDAVSSVQVRGAAYAPEFGISAGAVTTVETQRASDQLDVTVNDLEPRIRRRGGEFKGIESWTPRVTIGGPIVKGKLAVLESMQYQYSQTQVFGLPPFESDTKVQSFESFTRADWMINPSNRFTGSAMVSPRKTTYAGLNTFNPQSVTSDIQNHNILASASDQVIVGANGVFEGRVSLKQFDSTIGPSQGHGPMVLAPDRNSGSYFNDQDRTGRRAEWFNTYSFLPLGPNHLVKVGAGVIYETVDGFSRNRPIEIVGQDGTLIEQTAFQGGGVLDRKKTALRGYAQDAWTVASNLTVQYGARYDYESIVGDFNVAPRGSVTLVATRDGRTIVRAGAGVFYNAVPLNVAAFDELQTRVVTEFAQNGATPSGATITLPNVVASGLADPRSVNWNVDVDRELLENLFVRVGYQQRENRFESVVDTAAEPTGAAAGIVPVGAVPAMASAIVLRTDGRSRYREGQITTRYKLHADEIVGSYTRSSAVGNLNDFNSFFGNIENPVIRPDERGPLPWDAPNRVLIWANIALPRDFALFPVFDTRTGFPLSNVHAARDFVGPRNAAGRYPTFVSLDAQVTKKLRVFGHKATIGLKVFNITNRFNPRDYQGNLASRNFGGFDNSVGRTFRGKWIFEF